MTTRRRVLAAAWVSLVLALALPAPAGAHALLEASEPADGATLPEPPTEIVLRFTESPEPALSSIVLLDTTGAELDVGEAGPAPGDPSALSVSTPELQQGAYTVTWRTVSQVDGHPSGGAFTFGVGVSPVGAIAAPGTPETPPASPLEMAGRLIIFLGLGLLIGAAWIGAIAFSETPEGVRRLAGWAWAVSILGLVVLAIAQQQSSGAGFGDLLPTKVGRALLYRGGAILLAGAGLLAARLWPSSRRRALILVGVGATAAMLAHVIAGHAAARGDLAWLKVIGQWVHFAAAGVWLGGLAALLAGIRGEADDTKAIAVRRFSLVAGFALAAVVVTGVIRSIQEIGDWGALFSTGYGIAVLVKAALILALAGLGAINRYRHVGEAATSLRGLRRVSRGELALAVAAVGAAAVLATLVPPAQVPAQAGPPPGITVSGSDFAKSVRLRLEVSPGLPGSNQFSLHATDYDSGEPIEAQRVALQFSFLGGAEVAPSTLELHRLEEGRYHRNGGNLSIGGPWAVSALVQQGTDSVEVPLELATVCNALRIEGTKPNEPTVSTVDTPDGGSVEGYVIELGQGRFEVHFTFIGPDGKEVAVEGLPSISAWRRGAPVLALDPIPLTEGHFLAEAQLAPGDWRFDGSARSAEGSSSGCFEETVG
jgi:putative copper export protein/methionine-rich copper-binding protein CopC